MRGFILFSQLKLFLTYFCLNFYFYTAIAHFITLFISSFSGLGQDDSEYIDVSKGWHKDTFSEVFGRAGFANKIRGEYKLLPCPLGTFVNSSVSGPRGLKCLECPAGKFRLHWCIKISS